MLEEDTQMDLKEYRSFIDEEMFTILGQMDSASKIFEHVYLVSSYKLIWFVVYRYIRVSLKHPTSNPKMN